MIKRLLCAFLLILLISGLAHASQNSITLPNTGTLSGVSAVNLINAANNTLATSYLGTSAPSAPIQGQLWADSTLNQLDFYDGGAWDTIGTWGSGVFTLNASRITTGTLPSARLPPPFTSGTIIGTTSIFAVMGTSTVTTGDYAKFDAHGNMIDGGASTGGVGTVTGDGVIFSNSASTGSVTLSLFTQNQKTFLAGPTSGVAATPTFRVLGVADLPSPFTSGTVTGNTSSFVTSTGTLTNGHYAKWDVNGNAVDGGSGPSTGGFNGQIIYNNSGAQAGFTMTGDCTIVASTGVITCTKSSGSSFGTAAFDNTGTSGGVIPLLNGTNTWTGAQTFGSGSLILGGSSSGITALNASASASGTLTLPAATDQLVGRATTDTLTNKTWQGAVIGSSYGGTGATTYGGGLDNLFQASGTAQSNPTNFVRIGTASYNAQNLYGINLDTAYLHHFSYALNAVKNGVRNARILWVGDSTTVGTYSTGATGDFVGHSQPTDFSNILNNVYHINSKWSAWLGGSTNPHDARLTVGSGWTSISTPTSLGGPMYQATAATSSLSLLPVENVDTSVIYYEQNTGNGSFTVNMNGGSNTTVNTNTGTGTINSVTITGTLGKNSTNINWSSGGTVNIVGVESYDSTTTQVINENAGWGGSKSTDWSSTTYGYSPLNALSSTSPDLTIICLGINDWYYSTGTSTYSTAIQALITQAKTTGDVILMTPNPSAITVDSLAVQAGYINVLYALAESNNIPLIDNWSQWQSYEIMNPLGFYYDTLHPTGAGYFYKASYNSSVLAKIAGIGGSVSGQFNASNLSVGAGYAGTVASPNGAIIQGSVGIGQAVTNNTLDVNGNLGLTAGQSIFWNGYYSGGYFNYTGTGYFGQMAQNSTGDFVVATGTTGTAGNHVTFTNDLIVKNAGNVGIGTSTVQGALDVATLGDTGDVEMGSWSGTSSFGALYLNGGFATSGNYNFLSSPSASLFINRLSGQNIEFREGNATPDQMIIATGGNVGIGTSTAHSKLDVYGTIDINGAQIAASNLSNGTTGSGNIALSTTPTFTTNITDPLVIGGTASGSTLTLESTSATGSGDAIKLLTGSQTLAMNLASGQQVGIGTTATGSKLNVSGNVSIGTTYLATGAPTDGMIVKGNVGIGTNAPAAQLDIGTGSTVGDIQMGTWSGGSSFSALYMSGGFATAGSYTLLGGASNDLFFNAPSSHGFHFRSGGGSDLFTISSAGAITLNSIASGAETDILCYSTSTGAVTYATSVAGCVPSSIETKDPKGSLDSDLAMKGVMQIAKPAVFTYKDKEKYGSQEYVGLYAQDVCSMDERLCVRDSAGKIVNYDQRGYTSGYLTSVIQSMQKEIDRLKSVQENPCNAMSAFGRFLTGCH